MEQADDTVRIVFFSSIADHHQARVVQAVSKLVPETRFHCHSTIPGLKTTLQRIQYGFGVIVILARSEDELWALIQLNGLLKNHSIVLILTSHRTDLTRQGLKLYPRYISYVTDDESALSGVLKKMIDKMTDKRRAEWQRQ